jgi:hypothetical protein
MGANSRGNEMAADVVEAPRPAHTWKAYERLTGGRVSGHYRNFWNGLAEAVGFEPTMPFRAWLISSQLQSTTLPRLPVPLIISDFGVIRRRTRDFALDSSTHAVIRRRCDGTA